MLILAGVTIATLTGDNGILTRASDAKEKTEEAEDIEKIKLAMSEAQIGKNGYEKLDWDNFQEALNSQFEGRDILLADNADGIFTVTLDDKIYNIENNQINELQVDLYINNVEELKRFRDDVNNGNTFEGKHILLTEDITLDINEEWIPIGVYAQSATTPQDENNIPFKGIFNAGGHKISNLNIATNVKAPAFFSLVIGGEICNLTVENVKNNSTFNSTCGGIANYIIDSKIINCNNRINITGTQIVGGITSQMYSSKIIQCSNYGTITSSETPACGGIVASANSNSTIINCSNYGDINSNSKYTGGIVGLLNSSKIQKSFNLANITNNNDMTGGITGKTTASSISNCYNIGNIEGMGDCIGGIVGEQVSVIENCYNIGNIKGDSAVYIGGIIGNNIGNVSISNNYYLDGSISGSNENTISGIEVKISDEMKKLNTILGNEWKEDTNNINNGYPILDWQ